MSRLVAQGRGRRAAVAELLERTGLGSLLRRMPLWHGVVVLGYHRVGPAARCEFDRTVFSAGVEDFESQLDLFARDFEVIGLADLDEALARRRGRALLITFDDGYRDQAEVSAPLLHARGLPAVFFLATGFVGEQRLAWWDELSWIARSSSLPSIPPDGDLLPHAIGLSADRESAARALHARYRELPGADGARFVQRVGELAGTGRPAPSESPWMSWADARRLGELGHDVGGHTVTHPILARLPPEEQRREVAGSLERLRAELGAPIESFAYPSGHRGSFDADTVGLLDQHGVRWAFSYRGGFERPGRAEPLDIRRIGVRADEPPELVAATVGLPFIFGREAS